MECQIEDNLHLISIVILNHYYTLRMNKGVDSHNMEDVRYQIKNMQNVYKELEKPWGSQKEKPIKPVEDEED